MLEVILNAVSDAFIFADSKSDLSATHGCGMDRLAHGMNG